MGRQSNRQSGASLRDVEDVVTGRRGRRPLRVNQRAALYIITACRAYHHAFACISSTVGCISHSPPPLRGAPCDSLFKTLTFLSLALACTLSTNENKFSSVNVSQREPQFRFPCRGGACSSRFVGCVPFNAGRRGRRYGSLRTSLRVVEDVDPYNGTHLVIERKNQALGLVFSY